MTNELMRATLLGLTMVLPLAGCETTGELVEEAGDKTAEAADVTLGAAERVYCDGATMGAVRRRFGDDPEALAAYLEACGWKTWPEARGAHE